MDETKLQQAIDHLKAYYHTVDDIMYPHYTIESLKKELAEIQASIDFLESLRT